MSIYTDLINAGCKVESYYSDLYVKACPLSREITKGALTRNFFIDNINKESWIELPLQFDPYWKNKSKVK